MSLEIAAYVATGLAAAMVLVSRLHRVGGRWLGVHTGAGLLALVVWLVFLLAPDGTAAGDPLVGIVGLGLWWVTALAGLVLLARWFSGRGRHSSAGDGDRRSRGRALSLVSHLALLAAVGVLTWAYLTAAV